MDQGCNTRLHYQNLYSTTFLPMLCSRQSIKDVTIPKSQDPSTLDEDQLSPKISCIGQVKRNNKITGFPNHTTPDHNKLALTTAKNTSYCNTKYLKLRRFFSSKSLTSTATPATRPTTTSTCRIRRELVKNCKIRSKADETSQKAIDIVDLDPPLPVIKKRQEGDKPENLWKRRTGGYQLRSLQLPHIQLNPNHQTESPTV